MEHEPSPPGQASPGQELAEQAIRKDPGIVGEFFLFLAHEKKWWLAPIVFLLLLLGLFVFLSSTALAPFIYPF